MNPSAKHSVCKPIHRFMHGIDPAAITAVICFACGLAFLAASPRVACSPSASWGTANLSEPRVYLAATSLLDIAMFAGGTARRTNPIGFFASNVVDIFNATSGAWHTAVLSEPRTFLASTSLPSHSIAFFAGGRRCAWISLRFFVFCLCYVVAAC